MGRVWTSEVGWYGGKRLGAWRQKKKEEGRRKTTACHGTAGMEWDGTTRTQTGRETERWICALTSIAAVHKWSLVWHAASFRVDWSPRTHIHDWVSVQQWDMSIMQATCHLMTMLNIEQLTRKQCTWNAVRKPKNKVVSMSCLFKKYIYIIFFVICYFVILRVYILSC